MAQVENRQVVVNIVADDVQKAQEALTAKQKKLNDEIKKTNDPKALADFNKQLKATEQQLQRNEKVLKGELLPTYNQLTSATKRYAAEFKKTGDPEVLRKYQETNRALSQMKGEMTGLEKASQGLTRGGVFSASFWANLAANGVQRAAGAFSNFFRGAISEALDAEEATARLNSTLDNLGRSDAFDRISRKADEMANKFRYLDNDEVLGVFEKLIDYGKLTEREMNELLPVIINFAAKSRTSIGEATDVIVKALQGNGKALKQYGIDIKDAGSETERLNVVMTTLKEKTDGAADAFQKTAKGSIATAIQQFNNLKEEVGENLIPILTKLLQLANKLIKPLSFILGAGGSGSRVSKELLGNPDIIASGDNERLALEKRFEQIRAAALKKGLSEKDALNDIFKSLLPRKSFIESNINRLSAEAAFSNGEEREIKLLNVQKLAAELLGITKFIDDKTAGDKALGIIDKTIAGGTTVKNKTKEVEEMTAAIKNLGDVVEKELRRRNEEIKKGGAGIGFGVDFESGLNNGIARARQGGNRSAIAALELQVLKARAKARLDAELALLKEQQRQELENKELTENEKLLIEEEYRKKRKDAELAYFREVVDEISKYANAVVDIISAFAEIQNQKEDAALAKDRRMNEQKIRNLENRLKRGLISQKEYDRQVADIEKQQQKREREIFIKQFKRNQKLRVVESIMNTAEGVTEAYPNLILAALVGIAGAAKTALIASQKPPEFAKGGLLGGRTHAQGGNAIIDGSGRKIAEIEAGEGIINRRTMADNKVYSFTGTPSQIASQMNSMHGGTGWAKAPRYMNYSAINKRYYEDGGVFSSGADGFALQRLNEILENGIPAYVVFNQFETQQDRINRIRANARLK